MSRDPVDSMSATAGPGERRGRRHLGISFTGGMTNSSALRIALGADGVSIWSSAIFGEAEPARVRDFLSRAFAVEEVQAVDLRRKKAFGRIRYGTVANPSLVWRKLSRALGTLDDAHVPGAPNGSADRIDAGHVYLDTPGGAAVSIHRVGNVLSTWRVREQGTSTLRLSHPVLRNRRDLVFRLEEELASLFGVEEYRASAVTGGVSIRFDTASTTAERLAWQLEKAWPRLLEGLDGPPSQKRLVSAAGLLGLSVTGQFFVPAVRPVAVAGMAIYSLPNVLRAGKELTRGEVGIAALYTTGVGFMLASGLPFAASVFATLMQLWPHLAHRKVVSSQRRLFAAHRRVPGWARVVSAEGVEVEVNVEQLGKGGLVVVRAGDVIPVDGIVENGSAAVLAGGPFGSNHVEDRSRGDAVAAGTSVREGNLTIRVERAGAQTALSFVGSLLPHAHIAGLPSSLEAERIANRNAKPALGLAALSLFLTRLPLPAQAVIRPDYATAPRLAAQLSALRGIALGLQRGVLFRNPGALDRLSAVDHIVIDESAGLGRRRLQVARVDAVSGVSAEQVVSYALAAFQSIDTGPGRALAAIAAKLKAERVEATSRRRSIGVTRYCDALGHSIEVATAGHLAAAKLEVPQRFHSTLKRRHEPAPSVEADAAKGEPAVEPLWVLRDGIVIGGVAFSRTGELVGKQVVAALTAAQAEVRIVHVSRSGDAAARQLARTLGIGFSTEGPSQLVTAADARRRGRRGETLWIGDGSSPGAGEAIAAGSISVSVAPLSRCREEAADILLPGPGLSGLPRLLELGRAHTRRLEQDYQTVYVVNLLGVAGAIFAGFSGLQSGLLSNVGTGLVYARHAMALNWLASTTEKRRARLKVKVPAPA